VVDTSKSEEVRADAWEAYRVAAAKVTTDADTELAREKRRLFGVNHDALKAVEEWRAPLKPTNERERQRKQRGPLLEAIQEVQECALNRRKAPQEPEEDLLNDTATKNWMPWLYDAMVGPDADPDVKRVALEAGDKADINQIYAAGASKQQWGAFVTEYRIRQILWIRDNPGKVTGGTQRQTSAGATTLAGRPVARSDAASTCADMVAPQRDVRPGGRRHRVR
jgi:hypothetical protein